MRINTDDRFLSLERVEPQGTGVVWQIQAAVASEGCIVAVHGRATVRTTEETPEQVADFTAHRAQRLDLMLSKGGWLRLKRAPGGRTLVRYRFGRLSAGASLEGELRLEGESAEACCRELGGLL
ncbi:MAG: hypothetical protein LUO89_10265 [Methanothrix sp.]|nr:hypothetical protein [Methanothrix sp.]